MVPCLEQRENAQNYFLNRSELNQEIIKEKE